MADQNNFNIPWAGVAVVVALISSTLLVPRAFDHLRPPEKERAQLPPGVDLEIDARLWEDPFFALRRFENERAERCGKAATKAAGGLPLECRADQRPEQREPAKFVARMTDRNRDGDRDETLVIAALVPGNPFVGAEESRRRTRYALLAGLQSQDYVPDNAERIGLMQFVWPRPPEAAAAQTSPAAAEPAASAASASASALPGDAAVERETLMIPYELLSERPQLRGDGPKRTGQRYAQIALLWIDEAALAAPRLNTVARLIDELFGAAPCKHPKLVVVGPSSSDALRIALSDLTLASRAAPPTDAQRRALESIQLGCKSNEQAKVVGSLADAANPPAYAGTRGPAPLDWEVRRGYAYLAQADFMNAGATAADNQLEELDTQKLQNHLNAKFSAIVGATQPLEVKWKRMVATDSIVLKQLVREIRLRLPDGEHRRIVLVAERDSLYAQALVSELKFRTLREAPELTRDLSFEPVYFYRGLDGVTTRDNAQRSDAPVNRSPSAGSADSAAMIEWPEARDQLDYLRRMAGSLKDSEAQARQGPISAIGILASDVHDKLLVLQALHETFADKVFFTTDMDARFLHPRTMGFTRNLVVATSLPLKIASTTAPEPVGEAAASAEPLPGLQVGTPPLRDMYQTAVYLAARRAACGDKACQQAEDRATQKILEAPSVYEIGRSRAVPLAGYALEARRSESSGTRAVVATLIFTALAAALLVWPSTPALRRARVAILRTTRPRADGEGLNLPTAFMVALHFGLLSFALGTLIELIEPGHLGFIYILMFSALGAFGAIVWLYPAARASAAHAALPDAEGSATRRRIALVGVLSAVLLVAWALIAWRALSPAPCIDCEPVEWLEGVSAWPSHLIHLLALFVIACALDYSWSATLFAIKADGEWVASGTRLRKPRMPKGAANLWREVSVLAWRRPRRRSVDFRSLWWQYAVRGQSQARALRTLVMYAVTSALVLGFFLAFNDGQVPSVPVRGAEHRSLFGWTLAACVLLLTLLIVAVADATMLGCRFIRHLNRTRTSYPAAMVTAFAQALGPERVALWTERMAKEPSDRAPAGGPPGRHTLLDDWIDIQLVARRTALIAPLVIGPFVVLALLVVARSRLFDNWSLTLPIAAAAGAYLLWLIVLAMLLKSVAEQTRTKALERMEADLRWMMGSPRHAPLIESFKALIAAVRSDHRGAFAGFFDQPLFKALLVPLGGAGGAQLFDYLLLAR